MISPKIEKQLVKFLTNQATASELDALEDWIKEPGNLEIFKCYLKVNYATEYNMRVFNTDNAKSQLLDLINKEKKVIKLNTFYKISKFAAAAAIIGVLIAINFFSNESLNNSNVENSTIVNTIKIGTDKAALTLEDGSIVALEKGKSFNANNLTSNGEELVYTAAKEVSKPEIAYNYLTIPRGGQFFVQLSDGTKVWLNSESKLKYPVNFVYKEPRQVELVYGEAYFEVSPSSLHNGAKFKVFNQSQEIEVLGTKFNIKAYQDEDEIYTTLVEGSVSVDNSISKTLLKPNQQSVLNRSNKDIIVAPINALSEISWVNGNFVFERKSLKKIAKVLSRWYDVEVDFIDKKLEEIEFTGKLSKNQNIEEILILINNTHYISAYEINKNTVLIK